jgi:hypothetical protein
LMANIVLPPPVQGQSNWTPIGRNNNSFTDFTGTFDGYGHTITGLNINITDGHTGWGMFGYIRDGVVQNLGLINVNIIGGASIGGIAVSIAGNTRIENCFVTGTISVNDPNNLNSGNTIGGIVGHIDSGTVQNCFSIATISGLRNIGGIAGANDGTIKNCMALGVSIARQSGVSQDFGRITVGAGTTTNNYAHSNMTMPQNVSATSNADGIHGADLASNAVILQSTWETAGFVFYPTGPWVWDNTGRYKPRLKNSESQLWPSYITGPSGTGSSTSPFLVRDERELRMVGRDNNPAGYQNWTLSAHYKLMADIKLTQGNWIPIGSATGTFTGVFDGYGHTITGLRIDSNNTYDLGMFGNITNGVVRNLGLINVNINGSYHIGGIAGMIDHTTIIENSFVTGTIVGQQYAIGGIVGWNSGGTVRNCFSIATISGPLNTGGIAGLNSDGRIENSMALGVSIAWLGGTSQDFGRVTGNSNGTLVNNFARGDMSMPQGNVTPNNGGVPNGIHGGNITSTQWTDENWWRNTAFRVGQAGAHDMREVDWEVMKRHFPPTVP